jgi:hypothetical protein
MYDKNSWEEKKSRHGLILNVYNKKDSSEVGSFSGQIGPRANNDGAKWTVPFLAGGSKSVGPPMAVSCSAQSLRLHQSSFGCCTPTDTEAY